MNSYGGFLAIRSGIAVASTTLIRRLQSKAELP